ncbi:MAG: SpoIIE family protein phosphatase [Phycisphaeraceae bacterium]|nr:SpoIIE family protein phosphatase [Phycisphaeraceae bacterium]
MSPTSTITRVLHLEPVAGPPIDPLVVSSDRAWVLGRQSACDIVLADSAVSRRHAELSCRADSWLLKDLASSHGTYLNGVRLIPDDPAPIHDGDSIRIGPWLFRIGPAGQRGRLLSTSDDAGSTYHRIQRVSADELAIRAQHRLELILDCAASITAADSEFALAQAVLDALVSGTGFPRAAFLRPSAGGFTSQIEVLATREVGPMGIRPSESLFTFSRSLMEAAADGQIARLEEGGAQDYGQSVMQLGIQAALCAPIMLDAAPVAYLYLDSRRHEIGKTAPLNAGAIEPDAPAFCQALARITGLALANLHRGELAHRQRQLEADLNAAREAQRLIMPAPDGRIAGLEWSIRSRPGRFVAGDLIDVMPMPDGRVAVFLGDVSGKGVEAAMLMATAQAHLNASLHHSADPAAAIADANRHITAHSSEGRFITLWLGVFNPADRSLAFVDAGHGHALVCRANAPAVRVESTGGLPLGIDASAAYTADRIVLDPDSRLILYSDGLVEQQSPAGEEFGMHRIISTLSRPRDPAAEVTALLSALAEFAAPAQPPDRITLADDVTIASLRLAPA